MGMKAFPFSKIPAPCTNCIITGFKPNLVFDDGSTANANTGMWLHHIVFFNLNRTDSTCSKFPERFAAAGNERTPGDLTIGG